MPPYPDEGGKASSPSSEPFPALKAEHINPSHASPDVKVESLPQPVLQAALSLAAPYYSGDSDSDDNIPVPATSIPVQNEEAKAMQTLATDIPVSLEEPKHMNGDAVTSTTSAPLPAPTVLHTDEKLTVDAPTLKKASAEESSPTAAADTPGSGPTDKPRDGKPDVKSENVIASDSKSLSPDCVAPANSKEDSPSGTAEPGSDSVVVSKNCVNDIMDMLSSRITELEHIRERKRARVEQLSSAAFLAQSSAMAAWPQTAGAMVAQTTGMPPGALGLMPGAVPAASSRPGTPFMPVPEHPSLAGALPPPPPPPPPDGTDRKQSRYWTADEHQRFLAAIKTCGPKNYVQIAEIVGTRNAKQVRTHAQKFQKKLEREETKRREDMERHGGPSVSAAAVAAVAAAAAAMHRGGPSRHLTTDNSADRGFAQPLLPFAGIGPTRGVFHSPLLGPPGAALGDSVDGSSSTNDVSGQHQHAFTVPHIPVQAVPAAPNAAIAAIAAEAATLGGRVFGGGTAGAAEAAEAAGQASNQTGPSGAQKTESGVVGAASLKREAAAAPSASGAPGGTEPPAKKSRNHTAMTENQIGASQVQTKQAEVKAKPVECLRKTDEVSTSAAGGASDSRKSDSRVASDEKTSQLRSSDDFSGVCAKAKPNVVNSSAEAAGAAVPDGRAMVKKSGGQAAGAGIVAAVSELKVSGVQKGEAGAGAVAKEPESATPKAPKK